MNSTRREFVRTVVLGGGAVYFPGCGTNSSTTTSASSPQAGTDIHRTLLSEKFEACHHVRDGGRFEVPPSSRRVEVAIIGGGPSGLICAYRLRDRDIVLIEKEPIVGGNARTDIWQGIPYAAGAITTAGSSPCMKLYEELGLQPEPMRRSGGARPYVVDGKLYSDIWQDGLDSLVTASVRRRVLESRQMLLELDLTARKTELDRVTLASVLAPYGPEVKDWYNDLLAWFAGTCDDYSGYAGALLARSQMGHDLSVLYPERASSDKSYSFPGGLAVAARALGQKIEESGPNRLISDAVVYRIAHERDGVAISYLHGPVPVTIRASVAIVAAPKFIARHIVADLPAGQKEAMGRFRYTPFLVAGVCTRARISSTVQTARVLRAPIANLRDASPGGERQLFRCEAPLQARFRPQVLADQYIRLLGDRIVGVFEAAFPGSRPHIEEVRIWRRGHNWYLPVPHMSTGFQPAAARRFKRILLANADSVGEISEFGWAMVAAERAVDDAESLLRPSRQTLRSGYRS